MTAALAPPPLATPAPVAHGRAPHLRVVSSPSAAGDVGARTDRLADGLAARFGTAPQAFWPVPGAVSLPGTQGLVCGAGLFLPVGRQALVAVRRDQDDRIEFLNDVDLPRGAGLSSVAAERCALRLALRDLGRPPTRTPWTVAELVVRSAREASAVAAAPREDAVRPVTLDLGRAGFSALLLDTGQRHLGAGAALLPGGGRSARSPPSSAWPASRGWVRTAGPGPQPSLTRPTRAAFGTSSARPRGWKRCSPISAAGTSRPSPAP